MGHSSIKVTFDIYGHLVPGANRVAVDGLGDSLVASGFEKSGFSQSR